MNTPKGTKPPPSKNVFIVSDTHFGHANICKFTCRGVRLRPWDRIEDHDEALVANWNAVVKPTDKVYHLGDVAIAKKSLDILSRLHGDKILIRGNHDIFKLEDYAKHFRDIRASSRTHPSIHRALKGSGAMSTDTRTGTMCDGYRTSVVWRMTRRI
jgi:calcineurin-like phosphoesterase family protein